MRRNPTAAAHFERMSVSQRYQYIRWIANAKREETRLRRLAIAIKRLEANKKPGDP